MTEREGPSPVWKLAEEKLPKIKGVEIAAEISYVLNYLEAFAPDIYFGSPVPVKSEQEIINLAKNLSNNISELRIQIRFNFVAAGFEIGNTNYGWKTPLVPQLVRIKKPKSWATTESFARRNAASKLEKAFSRDLEQPASEVPSIYFGQLLFTAVFYGCLFERKWHTHFLSAVKQKDIYQHNGILWIEMVAHNESSILPDEPPATKKSYTKRFFPDNFTLLLLYRLLDRQLIPATACDTDPWSLLKTYLRSLPGLSPLELPGSLNEFLKLSISRNLFMPGSLLSYATGRLKSTSLAIGPWLRCISGKAVEVTKLKEPLPEKIDTPPIIKSCSDRYNAKNQEILFTKLLQELNPRGNNHSNRSGANVLDTFLEDHGFEISPTFQLMVYWGKQLFRPRKSYLEHRSKRKGLKVSTIHRYLSAINTPFLHAAADLNLIELESQELELIYEQVIFERLSDNMTPQCLQRFHGFLEAFYGLPAIESLNLKGKSSSLTNENANLITSTLYHLVHKGLGWGQTSTRWQRLRSIAWILCYRCGFRPSEALNLRTIDFQLTDTGSFELIIRLNPKTERGKRRVPGSILMSSDEISLLLSYYRQRCTEQGLFGDDYFLAHPEQKSGRLLEGDVFSQTRELLSLISTDETLRLYHARHTFNSVLQMQFMLGGNPPFGNNNFIDFEVSVTKDSILRSTLMGNEDCGRKDQYIQAILVGHASPEMTNQYYNHLNDMLLGCLVRQKRDRVNITLKTVMMLGRVAKSRADELLGKDLKEHPLATLACHQAKKHADNLVHPFIKKAQPLSLHKTCDEVTFKFPTLEEVLTEEYSRVLKRGDSNWQMAYKVFEGIRALKGKQLNSAITMIRDISSRMLSTDNRWRGPVYSSITELKASLHLLREIGVDAQEILLVHHARRGQSQSENDGVFKLWRSRIDTVVKQWCSGEMANQNVQKKGLVEIRVVNIGGKIDGDAKLPSMNRGFEISCHLLTQTIDFSNNKDLD